MPVRSLHRKIVSRLNSAHEVIR